MTTPMETPAAPLRYQPAFESLEEDEADTTHEMVEAMRSISETVHRDEGHAYRSVHAKSHGLLLAEVQVPAGLPAVLAQGAFAKAGNFPAAMRFRPRPATCWKTASPPRVR